MPTKLQLVCLAVGLVLALDALAGCSRVIGLGSEYYLASEEGGTAGGSTSHGGGGTSGDGVGGTGDSGGNSGTSAGGTSGGGGGGDAGAAGSPGLCELYPIPPRTAWIPSASSHGPNDSAAGLTDNMPTRWSSGKPQSGDEWLQIDFGETVAIRSINLQQGDEPTDYPRLYSVTISDTKNDLSGPAVFNGMGAEGVSTTTVLSQPHAGRYLLIKQLGSAAVSWWSVDEIEVGCVDD